MENTKSIFATSDLEAAMNIVFETMDNHRDNPLFLGAEITSQYDLGIGYMERWVGVGEVHYTWQEKTQTIDGNRFCFRFINTTKFKIHPDSDRQRLRDQKNTKQYPNKEWRALAL